jgi:[pyruvate, water dikinase]-phosphate phosphotransferase / [pyruvate, water dikinase] kinase
MENVNAQGRVTQIKQGPPIFIVSGGTGATAELLARTVLAQFPNVNVPLRVETRVLNDERVREVVARAAGIPGAIILHTMVNRACRHLLMVEASKAGVVTFDLTSPLLEHLSRELNMAPLGQPGLYRQLHRSYFDRIEAIEFTVAHDDGKRVEDLPKAEIVLIGVSRVGKTPLSMYLSMLGWKTANVPFVTSVPMPEALFSTDMRRVVGLMIEPHQLVTHRKVRQERMGMEEGSYIDRDEVRDELRAANHFFYQHEIPVVDTTNKPIETSAEEIAAIVARRIATRSSSSL